MDSCAPLPQHYGFISSTSRFIDCQAQTLGTNAYQALAAPGSTLSLLLSGFLTLFVALIGYNLLFGRYFSVRSGTIAAVKIGAVLALATSWPAYKTLVYDIVVHGPSEILAGIGEPSGLPGSDGTLLNRLDAVDSGLSQLAASGAGIGLADNVPPPPFAGFNAFALGSSRILFLLTAIAGLGSVKLVSGLMLALGPFFIGFLLFDATRSLFEGWVRVLAGAALGAVGIAVALGFELAFLEPWLTDVLARRSAGEALPSLPTELLVMTSTFAILAALVLAACVRIATAFRLGPRLPHAPAQPAAGGGSALVPDIGFGAVRAERPRARAIADRLLVEQWRESRGAPVGAPGLAGPGSAGTLEPRSARHRPIGAGRSLSRARPSLSASNSRRDLL